MPMTLPQRFLNALVRQRCHGKASMRDAEPRDLLGKHDTCGFHCLSLGSGLDRAPCPFKAISQDQLVNLTHGDHQDRNASRFAIRTLLTELFGRLFDSSY
jgi:hypothetical protein